MLCIDDCIRRQALDQYLSPFWQSASRWHETKVFVERLTAISHDTLHLFAGLLIWLAAALVLRRGLVSWLPLLVVLACALLNEAVDLWVELWPSPGMQLGEGTKDVVTTMAVPMVLFSSLRIFPKLVRNGGK